MRRHNIERDTRPLDSAEDYSVELLGRDIEEFELEHERRTGLDQGGRPLSR